MIKIGLKELETKIRNDSSEEISKIAAETKKEIDIIDDDIGAKAEREVEKVRKDGEGEVLRVKKRIIADANTQVKELLSSEKNRILEDVQSGERPFSSAAKCEINHYYTHMGLPKPFG